MSRVSYFQRFSQQENHATNNTLLMLRYLYQSSPSKLERLLTALLETDLTVGVTFDQQVKGRASVPDALIMQEPWRIYVETKRHGALDADQIRRHCESIVQRGRSGRDLLVGLTKEQITDAERQALAAEAEKDRIKFVNVSFAQVVEALRAQCADHERELLDIVEDYRTLLSDDGLLDERNKFLVVFPCGTSLQENARFSLYYEPPSRPLKKGYRYIGLYSQKQVAYVGTVAAIAVGTPAPDGTIAFEVEDGKLTQEHRDRVKAVVEATSYYDLRTSPLRYYVADEFVPTSARKISPYGMLGLRYLPLEVLNASYTSKREYTSAELAELLMGATWE